PTLRYPMNRLSITRRRFVQSAAATVAALGAPAIVPSHVFGKESPSNTLRIGLIGSRRTGHGDMAACLEAGLATSAIARIVAVCDVDRHRVEHARGVAERFYADRQAGRRQSAIATFDDYRDLLARDDIDGVIISTPDHWHAVMAVAAANAGKDMYV